MLIHVKIIMIHPLFPQGKNNLVFIQSLYKKCRWYIIKNPFYGYFYIESRIVRIILNVQMYMKVHGYGELQIMERMYNYVF